MPRQVQTLTRERKCDNPTSEKINTTHAPHQSCQVFKGISNDIFLVIDNISFNFTGHCGMPTIECEKE